MAHDEKRFLDIEQEVSKLQSSRAIDPDGYYRREEEKERVAQILAHLTDIEDGRINFRINSEIKKEFERLCGVKGSTLSRELRRFMAQVISKQRL